MKIIFERQRKLLSTLAIAFICVLSFSLSMPAMNVQADNYAVINLQTADYGDKLTLNSDLKLGEKQTFTKNGLYKTIRKYKKAIKGTKTKVKYTVTSSRKESGDNYIVTYKVKAKFTKNPKLKKTYFTTNADDDAIVYNISEPGFFYTVFDYKTGICLEKGELGENALSKYLGVKVKGGKWKYKYYGKQFYTYHAKSTGATHKKCWFRFLKSVTTTFKVTYPKTCDRVVVAIGNGYCTQPQDWDYFSNYSDIDIQVNDNGKLSGYWDPWWKMPHYKQGKKYNTISYIRLPAGEEEE